LDDLFNHVTTLTLDLEDLLASGRSLKISLKRSGVQPNPGGWRGGVLDVGGRRTVLLAGWGEDIIGLKRIISDRRIKDGVVNRGVIEGGV
jgi:hypothetical protein